MNFISKAFKPFFCLIILITSFVYATENPVNENTIRQKAYELYNQGNYKDSLELLKPLLLNPDSESKQAANDYSYAINCFRNLYIPDESDTFRKEILEKNGNNWRLLNKISTELFYGDHNGYIVGGEFKRGGYRNQSGKWVFSINRDRAEALQILLKAKNLIEQSKAEPYELSNFYWDFLTVIQDNRYSHNAWKLGALTDLKNLPDYEESYYYNSENPGAPVDEEGNLIIYKVPDSFESAVSDGERWKWFLNKISEVNPQEISRVDYYYAEFMFNLLDVHTIAGYLPEQKDEDDANKNIYSLKNLSDDETIARLATGIKKIKLTPDINYIAIFKKLSESQNNSYAQMALDKLSVIYSDRRQYDKAAGCLQTLISKFSNQDYYKERLAQIINNWGEFQPLRKQPSGTPASILYRYRNGSKVHLEAKEINVPLLLQDVKNYLKSNPLSINREKIEINNIGYRLVEKNENQYIKGTSAKWDLELKPDPLHYDKVVTIEAPIKAPGAYLVTATMENGNTSRIVMWINDTIIVKKTLDKGVLYFTADAQTGKPVSQMNIDFLGYKTEYLDRKTILSKLSFREYNVITKEFSKQSGKNGLLTVDREDASDGYSWLITASSNDNRFAYMGFDSIWYGSYYDYEYNQTKIYFITDRPVYRPAQSVKFKCWLRYAKYDIEDVSDFANREFTVDVYNPKNEKIYSKTLKADKYGGLEDELKLPKDAALGIYNIRIENWGGYSNFRVEEYKKPEFEVKITKPSVPVTLGEKIKVKLQADYFFGAPVVKAKVKYKIQRYNYSKNWYPIGIWDWLYEPGYWWFAYNYDWYPGWRFWGCEKPWGFWNPFNPTPPELIASNEVPIGNDGSVEIIIDTEAAKAIHGDKDHKYEITAEVTDESRRTIVGTNSIIIAKEPFKVYAWVDRGYFKTGDVINADFMSQTIENSPVQGKGILKLFKITLDKNEMPEETEVEKWEIDTNEQGQAKIQFKAGQNGQYRLSYTVTDSANHAIEGAYVFSVVGENINPANFRFNELEIIPNKKEFAPNDKANILINANYPDSTVLLFIRPSNGVYLEPKVIYMNGKSTEEIIEITKKDMPNIFIEALTINNGQVYTEIKEIVVPPEKRVLNVEVLTSKETYKPGEKAEIKLKITDIFGKPFKGTLALTVYDEALEYISGGSNVPEIKAFFWKWRRSHYTQTSSNVSEESYPIYINTDKRMQLIGAFGNLLGWSKQDNSFATDGDVGSGQRLEEGGSKSRSLSISMRKEKKSESIASQDAMKCADMEAMPAPCAAAPSELSTGASASGEQAIVQPTIRTNFADTAYFAGTIDTDSEGLASVSFDMPENLTGWFIKVWAMGHGTKVGEGKVKVVTKKNLLLRMQSPRFFVETDEVTLSANIHNYLSSEKEVTAVLELEGDSLSLIGEAKQIIKVSSKGEQRVDWQVKVIKEGTATLRMKALTNEESDAMEMKFPVYVHGIMKTVSKSNAMRPETRESEITFSVPAKRKPDETLLEIRYSPTLAASILDALPYLADYPYGCTEQTLNRFLPAVLARKVLKDMNIKLPDIAKHTTNTNAQETGNDSERMKGWKRYKTNPVFNEQILDEMIEVGFRKLYSMQLGDGGWGWFSGYGETSSPHLTSIVIHGLQIAELAGLTPLKEVMEKGVYWLLKYQKEEIQQLKNAEKEIKPWKTYADDMDAFIFMVLSDAGKFNKEMSEFLYRDRTKLKFYAKAMYGLALFNQKEVEKYTMIMQNIEQYVVQDKENQTAYLNLQNGDYWWYWYGSEFEAYAYYLKLLSRIKPKDDLTSGLVKYIVNNRKNATYWNSTRDTALCIEALAEYMKASGETEPDMNLVFSIDGKKIKEVQINSENLFTYDNKIILQGKEVTDGEHKILIEKSGKGPLYINSYLSYFSLEDFITKAGLEIKVDRKYYKLIESTKETLAAGSRGQAVSQKTQKYDREEITPDTVLKSSDLVEIELLLESKNDYEYVVLEDLKPAGCEPVEVRSGYNGNELNAYVEFRDEKVDFFTTRITRGKHSVSYRMRAEIPGQFSALPAKTYAMYAPELRGNSDEIKIKIKD